MGAIFQKNSGFRQRNCIRIHAKIEQWNEDGKEYIHVKVDEEAIAEVIGLATTSERWYELHTSLQNVALLFLRLFPMEVKVED